MFRKQYLLVIILAAAIAWLAPESAHAQFRQFGGSSSFSGGGSSSSYGTQRSYYTNGMVGEAIIQADHDTRSIIVITDEETNEHIKKIIESLDHPVQQVLIKVVFLEVTYRNDTDIGIEGSININGNSDGTGNMFQTAYGLAAETRGGFYTLLEKDLNLTMRAIAEVGHTEVLSRPSILTRNNQEAVITVGKEVPFVTNSRISDTGQTINTVEYQDIGIILRVTPFITQDGLVEMILAPEISTVTDETVPISDTINSPVFAKRSADTVVVTPNGKTVVIGGMMEDNKTKVENKIPILGDIPLLGMAFRRNTKNDSKTELIIFLTPYVVEGPQDLVKMSQSERDRSELSPQAFDQKQLDKYIDNLPPTENKLDEEGVDSAPAGGNSNGQSGDLTDSSVRRNSKGRPF
ncbi:MAG: hypothetical protein GC154_14965 [bacterium]|nr:hypothetical protein [bacterium]